MAAEIIQSVNQFDLFTIGTVYGYDEVTRELDVYIPKIMPEIPEGQKDIRIHTNMSLNNIDTEYEQEIITSSTIRVKALDFNEPLPDLGSKVNITFIDSNIFHGVWQKFNVNNDYNVIESEKYKKLFNLHLGDRDVEVYEGDDIRLKFTNERDILIKEDGKDKTLLLKNENNGVVSNNTIVDNTDSELESFVNEINDKFESYKKDTNQNISDIKENKLNRDLIEPIVIAGVEYTSIVEAIKALNENKVNLITFELTIDPNKWSSSEIPDEYASFNYKATLYNEKLKGAEKVYCTFNVEQAMSGNYCPVQEVDNEAGYIVIYSNDNTTTVKISVDVLAR